MVEQFFLGPGDIVMTQISFSRQKLLDELKFVGEAIPSRTTKPILQSALVRVDGDSVVLYATDLENGVETKVEALKVPDTCSFMLDVKKAIAILTENKAAETAEFLVDDRSVKIKTGKNSYSLPAQDPGGFPLDFCTKSPDKETEIERESLLRMINLVDYAADESSSKFATNAGLLSIADGLVKLTCTDTKRVAIASASIDDGEGNAQALIPAGGLSLVRGLIHNESDRVKIQIFPERASFRCGDRLAWTRLAVGSFPPCEKIIPRPETIQGRLSSVAGSILAAVKQTQIMTDSETRAILISLSEDGVKMRAQSALAGEAEVEVEANYAGLAIEIKLDPLYLLDVMRKFPADQPVELQFVSDSKPALFSADSFTYVVMPMGK